MTSFYDALETRDPAAREAGLFRALPDILRRAMQAPRYEKHLKDIVPEAITSREALSRLPVLRKSDLSTLQKGELPFGGLVPGEATSFSRFFTSPGPIFEAEVAEPDPWWAARGLYAAGLRRGDVVINTLSYHMTPGGFIMDSGARALGCTVIPAGPGNTEQQYELIEAYRPTAYLGTPDFLKILADGADQSKRDISSIRCAVVSGAAFPKSLQEEFSQRGIAAFQAYATADLGFIAYETAAREGLIVNENIIVEIVRPGTGDPVPVGDVGEIVVTTLSYHRPWVRLALGDLTAVAPGMSSCGRTNMRIKGWMGRADQATKIKGMFVRPEQIAELARRHPGLGRLRLVVSRENETDIMTLKVETSGHDPGLSPVLAATLQDLTKLKGRVELVPPASLPNDGKVISDERVLDR
ncbi:phenylacetate--CoA ligase family protein [Microvirga rosea]|uniref:phenylacetate--CoA ligase family protein n=1 Tax=Microvirga rosea TaxID=2715425 RepID=UPI001D0ACE3D|nr:AMP-binding protein [Microvirga rosea]MCB8823052.1 AMP-binding protein [Microvirga rosea]